MADPSKIPDSILEELQTRGAALYLKSYVMRMARKLGVDTSDEPAMMSMVGSMVEPMNRATEATWRAMMEDPEADKALDRFKESLTEI